MGSICGDFGLLSRRQLCSKITELMRENNCLKTDLLRLQLMANKCQTYILDLENESQITDDFDSDLRQQIRLLMTFNGNEYHIDCGSSDLNISVDEALNETIDETIDKIMNYDFSNDNKSHDNHSDDNEDNDSVKTEVDWSERPDETNGDHFECDYDKCDKIFDSKRALKTHERRAHSGRRDRKEMGNDLSGKPFSSGHKGCDYKTTSKVGTKRKIKSRHEKTSEGLFACDWMGCDRKFISPQNVRNHKYSHTGETFPCDVDGCKTVCQDPHSLRCHKTVKHVRKLRCEVKGCQFTAGSKSRLRYHSRTHSYAHQFKCALNGCNKAFNLEQSMNEHQFREHPDAFPDIPWIQCPHNDCQFKSKEKKHMERHVNIHTMKYRCSECGKTYPTKHGYDYHRTVHDESLWHRCQWPGCERTFIQINKLRYHMNTHTNEVTYRCHWPGCDKTFKTKQCVSEHVRNVHNLSGRHPCQWPGCDKVYATPGSLHSHFQRVHKGKADYRCHWPACGYTATSNVIFNAHMNKHYGSDDYRCHKEGCDFQTHKFNALVTHLKAHKMSLQF